MKKLRNNKKFLKAISRLMIMVSILCGTIGYIIWSKYDKKNSMEQNIATIQTTLNTEELSEEEVAILNETNKSYTFELDDHDISEICDFSQDTLKRVKSYLDLVKMNIIKDLSVKLEADGIVLTNPIQIDDVQILIESSNKHDSPYDKFYSTKVGVIKIDSPELESSGLNNIYFDNDTPLTEIVKSYESYKDTLDACESVKVTEDDVVDCNTKDLKLLMSAERKILSDMTEILRNDMEIHDYYDGDTKAKIIEFTEKEIEPVTTAKVKTL